MIPTWADQYVGAEYENHGRGPKFDCWGLARAVMREQFQIDLETLCDDYDDAQNGEAVHALIQREKNRWVEVEDIEQEGDLLLFRVKQFEWHVGVVLAPGVMLHIMKGCNAVIERFRGLKWSSRLAGIYRHPLQVA